MLTGPNQKAHTQTPSSSLPACVSQEEAVGLPASCSLLQTGACDKYVCCIMLSNRGASDKSAQLPDTVKNLKNLLPPDIVSTVWL